MVPRCDEIRAHLASRLSERGLAHSERVAATAVELAERFGIDPERARAAALLHDWHRETCREELRRRAIALGVPVTDVDEAVPYLLHGPVAAAELPGVFPGIDADICASVAAHTYGSATIGALDMIVYVADVIEPGRDHPGVEALRTAAATESLQELFRQAYAAALHHLIDAGHSIHPTSVATWNRIVAGDTP